ncbi:MAG TPA: hypothetical protein VHV30_08605 [Polyangiaceae bacterium]|jgi:hypothetical protein|nr:hypothetical protein [Polyangiaceae bacterium]
MLARILVSAIATAVVVSTAAAASAQPATTEGTFRTSTNHDGYGVVFNDDPLQAAGFDGTMARLALVIHAQRTTLIRPRTAFVVEMLKSVETL